jgi:hypothetical protein
MRPHASPDQLGEGEVATWAPSSRTLISGPTEAILIDALLTFENADRIAAWAKTFGKNITVSTSPMVTRTTGWVSLAFSSTSPRLPGTQLQRLPLAPPHGRTETSSRRVTGHSDPTAAHAGRCDAI